MTTGFMRFIVQYGTRALLLVLTLVAGRRCCCYYSYWAIAKHLTRDHEAGHNVFQQNSSSRSTRKEEQRQLQRNGERAKTLLGSYARETVQWNVIPKTYVSLWGSSTHCLTKHILYSCR